MGDDIGGMTRLFITTHSTFNIQHSKPYRRTTTARIGYAM